MAMNPEEEQTSTTLGIERWVQFGFITGALAAFWLLDHIVFETWNLFAEPNPNIATIIAGVGALVLMFGLYKHPKTNKFTYEVAAELSKVTWPTRDETWSNTIVVVVVSIIAAVILGVFDAAWSAVTDLIYKA